MELPNENELFGAYLNKAVHEIGLLGAGIKKCKKCKSGRRRGPLGGAGFPLADLFLLKAQVSEPELDQGVAFAGPAAEILYKAFEKFDLNVSHVYGTNALKCRTEGGELGESEIRACAPYLRAEIEICQPRVILAMGPLSLLVLKAADKNLAQAEYGPGQVMKMRPDLQLVLTCDLDASQMEEGSKRRFWQDLQFAKSIMDKESEREENC